MPQFRALRVALCRHFQADGRTRSGRAVWPLKLHGARRLTIRAWDALKASNGSVVLLSGSAAPDPKPGFTAVAATSAAIIALAKAFAEQGIKDGIQVNSVVPGAVMTRRRQSFLEKWAPAHNLTVEEAIKISRRRPASAALENRRRLPMCLVISYHLQRNG
jgi:NAD(P)-dependent dehydrogenase (short-subunit alcohol dehydrogenase family)